MEDSVHIVQLDTPFSIEEPPALDSLECIHESTTTDPADATVSNAYIHVWAIIGHLKASDWDIHRTADDYSIPVAAVQDAIRYYIKHRRDIEDRLRSNQFSEQFGGISQANSLLVFSASQSRALREVTSATLIPFRRVATNFGRSYPASRDPAVSLYLRDPERSQIAVQLTG